MKSDEKARELRRACATIDALEERIAELERDAMFDEPTGTLRKAAFREIITLHVAQAKRDGKRVTVLFIDVDYFKLVNADHSHVGADRILRNIATTIAKTIRGADVLGRFGGDEFAVYLTGSSDAVTARLQKAISENVRKAHVKGQRYPVTVTISHATIGPHTLNRLSPAKAVERLLEESSAGVLKKKAARG